MSNIIKLTIEPGEFISIDDFEKYLKKNLTKKYECGSFENCPLAEASGYAVGPYHYGVYLMDTDDNTNVSEPRKNLPGWATSFIERFDKTNIKDKDKKHKKTGNSALNIVKSIKKEIKEYE